jgi:hypothetical protein
MTGPTLPGGQPEYPQPRDHKSARAEAKAAKAHAKALRPWYKKKRFAIPLALVALIVLAQVFGGGGDETTTAQPSGSGSATSSVSGKTEPSSTPDPEPSEEATPTREAEPKAMKVKAVAILKDFEDNEAAADAKYGDKTLRVTGIVDKVDTEMFADDEYIIRLAGGGDFEILTVNCPGQSPSVAAKISKGDKVTVVGDFDDGGDLGVELKDCTLVKFS